MAINPLTREQKLLAEIVVQLGNITEAIQSAAAGEDSSSLNTQIQALQTQLASVANARAELQQQLAEAQTLNADLQTQLANVASARAELQQQLAEAQTLNADLQTQLAAVHEGDITPDNINQVMNTLGIDYDTV